MSRVPDWLVRTIILSFTFGAGLGLGLVIGLMDDPAIIVQDRWRVVTTAPPVTYLPETPFHVDPKVICETHYTTATIKPKITSTTVTTVLIPSPTTTIIPPTTTTTTTPPSTDSTTPTTIGQ